MNFSLTEAYSKTGFLKSKDQTPLFYRHYPIEERKAFILVVHGFGEHSGRYSHVIDRLRSEGYEVFCIDFRGHGHSKGRRGDIESFGLYEDDVLAAFRHIEKHVLGGEKLFVLAHSLGALVSLRAIHKSKLSIAGMILSSPLFGLKINIPLWKRIASQAAGRVLPQLRIGTGIKGRHLSSDQKFANAYDHDPLVLKNLSVRAFNEIFHGFQNANILAHNVSSSFFLQVAGDDPVVDAQASEQWFGQVDKKRVDASLKIYPGFLHEIYNETERREPIDDLVYWLNERA